VHVSRAEVIHSFEQLLQPLPVPGLLGGQIDPQPGVVTQLTDLFRRDERGPQHALLGQLRQPHRIQLVGLGSPRDLFDVAGVDQPGVNPAGLQQVEERPPVIRGGLDHDPLDPLAHQVVGQVHDRVRGGRHLPNFGHPPARDRVMRHARAHHPRRLRHVDRGDPRDQLLVLLGVELLRCSPYHCSPYHPDPQSSHAYLDAGCPGASVGNRKSNRRARSSNA
jgi:hypothetical protein